MSTDGDGDGNGDFVTYGGFNRYQNSQAVLCASYRSHLETKIDTMEKGIKFSVYLTGAAISIIVAMVTWYVNVVLI